MDVTPDVTLSTGTVVAHSRLPNGAQLATVANRASDEMTEAEWAEYCALRAFSTRRERKQTT